MEVLNQPQPPYWTFTSWVSEVVGVKTHIYVFYAGDLYDEEHAAIPFEINIRFTADNGFRIKQVRDESSNPPVKSFDPPVKTYTLQGFVVSAAISPSVVFTLVDGTEQESGGVVHLLPVEFKKMWETKNKANQIWNPTKKDDPATTGQQPNAVGQLDGVPRNKLYAVTDPGDGKYKVTVELGLPEAFRTKFYAAAYVGETKVANSDKAFTDEGLCNLEFAHSGASGTVENFAIRVGYDANSSTTLDPTEQVKLLIHTTSAKNATGEVVVLGTNADRYADAIDEVDNIVDGDWTAPGWATDLVLPHAKRFLQIFRDGNLSGLAVGMQPSSSVVRLTDYEL